MSRIVNPFVYGGPVGPTKFVGRSLEIERVLDQVTSDAHGSVAVIGERRIGKTSLLHYVSSADVIRRWNLEEARSVFLYLDCGVVAPFTVTRFWKLVLGKLNYLLEHEHSCPDLLRSVGQLLGNEEITVQDIQFLLDDLDKNGLLLVLMLDEFEWLVRSDPENEAKTRDFLAGLRALINHVPRTFSLVVATRQALDRVCREIRFMGSPFYNNFVFVYLRPFSREEAESFFDQILTDSEITFSKPEKDFIYGLAGTHPLLMQVAASLVFDFKKRGAKKIQDLLPVRDLFSEQVDHQFEDFWKWSQRREKEILAQLATGRETKLRDWVDERKTLLRRGLLIERLEKQYRLFSPIFQEWLTENYYRLGIAENDGSNSAVSSRRPDPKSARSDLPLVFISYSHKDEKEKESLMAHLGALQSGAGMIEVWSDDRIGGGKDWEREIKKAIDRAGIAILLVSANFLSSKFILGKEVPELLQRREREGLTLLPIVAKHCAWRKIDWLSKFNLRPKNGNPVWRKGGIYADQELSVIAEEVAEIVQAMGA